MRWYPKPLALLLAFAAAAASAAPPPPPGATNRPPTPAKRAVERSVPPGTLASANDTCAAAFTVPPSGPFPWTDTQNTTGNTTDATVPSCGGSVDEWYTFTPATSGTYTFSTCASSVDTILAVYTGTCGALAEVACVDDACGVQSLLSLALNAGTTYTIQILGWGGAAGSIPFTVSLAPPSPAVLDSWSADFGNYAWGIGYSDVSSGGGTRAPSVWTGEYYSLNMREFTTAGAPTGTLYSGYWADMEYDAGRRLMYHVDIPAGTRQDNCIHTWDPVNGSAGATICDPGGVWSGTPNQGVAYDPTSDTLFVGGWYLNRIYHIQGLSGASPGAVIESWPFGSVAGLAYLCDGTLAVVTNDAADQLFVADPAQGMAILRTYTLPAPLGYAGAGIDAQPDGPAWLLNQGNQTAYLVDLEAVCAACTLECSASADTSSGQAPLTVQFSSTAAAAGCSGPPTYAWDFGDGTTSTDQNPSHTYSPASTTTYDWTLTVSADGVTCTQTGSVTVSVCTLTCAASASPASGAGPLTVQFTGSAAATDCAGTPTYAWDFGDGTTSTEQNPSHTYAPGATTTFTWTLTVTVDGVPCTQTGTVAVTVAPSAYDVYIYDDLGRGMLCLDSLTGEFLYTVLIGYGAGQSFAGTAIIRISGSTVNFLTPPGIPYFLSGQFLPLYNKGFADYRNRPLRIASTAYDSNTRDNPPGCSGGL